MTSAWNAEQYERFKTERAHPFHDLVALIEPRPRMRIVDLGCGTGELTRALHQRLRAEETLGIDSSDAMLSKSAEFASERVRFEKSDIASFVADGRLDLIFSNAALHWIPDHETLFTRLASFLTASGQIAFQMPANDDHPSHTTAAEVATEMGVEPRGVHLLAPDEYAQLLHRLGFQRQHVRLQVYGHEVPSSRDVVEWNRGALLTEYEHRLGSRYPAFLQTYTERLIDRLGGATPFFYTYKRLLMWATF